MFDYWNGRSKLTITCISFIGIFLIGFIDYIIPWELYMFAFYLIPIFFTSWFAGRWPGILTSILGAGVWLIADFLSFHNYTHPFIPFWNVITIFSFFLMITYILTILKKALDREKEYARTDYVTGIANRRLFFELVDAELNKIRRFLRPITLVYIDLDNFKIVNDKLGHDTGDLVLLQVARTIKTIIRSSDVVARLGGDEFAILLPETEAGAAMNVIEKIAKNLNGTMKQNNWPVTFSIGVVTFLNPPVSVDVMVNKADRLMGEAKQAGKNQIKYQETVSD